MSKESFTVPIHPLSSKSDTNTFFFPEGRPDLDDPTNYLCEIAADTPHRTLPEALVGADVFLGVSAARLLTPEMLKSTFTPFSTRRPELTSFPRSYGY